VFHSTMVRHPWILTGGNIFTPCTYANKVACSLDGPVLLKLGSLKLSDKPFGNK